MLFKWTPNFVPNKIFIFGCGGTGSRVVPLIAQFIKSCAWVISPEIMLVDFDSVEEKNLSRQNFVSSDVGKNKAVVLANRYSKAFGINITPITSKVTIDYNGDVELGTYTKVRDIVRSQNRCNNLFILCVDSPGARQDIVSTLAHMCSDSHNNLVIDAGNENDFGQVTLHSIVGIKRRFLATEHLLELKGNVPVDCDIPFIPISPAYYDHMKEVTTASCAALDQSMAINCQMAVNIFSIVQNLYYVKPISFFKVNVSLQHGSIPEYISLDYFTQASECEYKGGDKIRNIVEKKTFTREFSNLIDEVRLFRQAQLEANKPVEVKKGKAEIKEEKVEVTATSVGPVEVLLEASLAFSPSVRDPISMARIQLQV